MADAGDTEGMSYAEFGAVIGRTKQRVGQLVAEGRIPTLTNGKIDAAAAQAALRAAAERASAASAMGAGADGAGGAADAKEARNLLALRRETLDYHERVGRLVDAHGAAAAQVDVARKLRDRLAALAERIAPDLVGVDEPRVIAARLRAALLEALTGLADDLEAEAERAEPRERAAELELAEAEAEGEGEE